MKSKSQVLMGFSLLLMFASVLFSQTTTSQDSYIAPLYPPEEVRDSPNYISALADFNKAVELAPDNDGFRENQVEALFYAWKFKECLESWDKMRDEKRKKESAMYAVQACKILVYEAYKAEEYKKSAKYLEREIEIRKNIKGNNGFKNTERYYQEKARRSGKETLHVRSRHRRQ